MAESPHEYVDPSDITKEDVISAFLQTIQRTINCLSAEEAKIRRTAIERLHIYLLKDDAAGSLPPADVLQVDFTLKEIVRVMALRMGQAPVLEDSEEIRLQLFSLLNDILLPECEISSLQTIIDPLHRVWIFSINNFNLI